MAKLKFTINSVNNSTTNNNDDFKVELIEPTKQVSKDLMQPPVKKECPLCDTCTHCINYSNYKLCSIQINPHIKDMNCVKECEDYENIEKIKNKLNIFTIVDLYGFGDLSHILCAGNVSKETDDKVIEELSKRILPDIYKSGKCFKGIPWFVVIGNVDENDNIRTYSNNIIKPQDMPNIIRTLAGDK